MHIHQLRSGAEHPLLSVVNDEILFQLLQQAQLHKLVPDSSYLADTGFAARFEDVSALDDNLSVLSEAGM